MANYIAPWTNQRNLDSLGFWKSLVAQPTFSCHKSNVLFHHTAIEYRINMVLQKFAHGETHHCKFKRTALCENALHYDNKTTINKQILCRFQKNCFQRSKNWNTPFYPQMFCALSGRSLSWNTPVFSRFTSKEHSNFIGCHFFHTHVLPHHSKSQLLGVAKSWKVALDRVPWFGCHVENLNDVIVYRSSSCGPEQWLSVIYNWLWNVLLKNNRSRTNKCYSRSLI